MVVCRKEFECRGNVVGLEVVEQRRNLGSLDDGSDL